MKRLGIEGILQFCFNESMDTSSVGFGIPSYIDIITFIVFQLWPATIFVSLILYGLLKRFLPKIKHPIRAVFFILSTIFTIYLLFEAFIKNARALYLYDFLILGIIVLVSITFSLICVLPLIFFSFLLKKNGIFAVTYILLLSGLFWFFYPKSQRFIVDKTARVGPERVCECLGISDKKNAEYYGGSSYVCFGVVYSCKESIVDQCPGLPSDVRCFTYDDLD